MDTDPLPNFEGGETDATLGVSGLVIALAVVSCGLRFYTRIFTRQGLGWDDWLIFVAVVATLATAALLLAGNDIDPIGLKVSENTDTRYVYTDQDVLYLKLAFASSILYFTIAGATKLGILLMYNRIFWVSDGFRYQLYAASGLVLSFWIACTVASFTNCIPLEWSWINSFADPRYCFDYNIFWMAAGACEIGLDVMILTLPIQAVMRMNLTFRRKLTVGGIFLLGGFVIITGIVKVVLGYPVGKRVPSYSNTEVWTTVHAGMAIVCASLPILRPLLIRLGRLGGWFITKVSSGLSSQASAGHTSGARTSSWSAFRGNLRHITNPRSVDEPTREAIQQSDGAQVPNGNAVSKNRPRAQAEPEMTQTAADDQAPAPETEMVQRTDTTLGHPAPIAEEGDSSRVEVPKGGEMRRNDSIV